MSFSSSSSSNDSTADLTDEMSFEEEMSQFETVIEQCCSMEDELDCLYEEEPFLFIKDLDKPVSPYMTVEKYRSLTNQARLRSTATLPICPIRIVVDDSDNRDNIFPYDNQQKQVDYLLCEIYKLKMQMAQFSRAVHFCKSMQIKFDISEGFVDAQRGLLIASQKYEAATNELVHQSSGHVIPNLHERGSVTIASIIISLKPQQITEETLWFVCLATNGKEVLATRAMQKLEDNELLFTDILHFANLSRDFLITVEVYMLCVRKIPLNSNEEPTICPNWFKRPVQPTTCSVPAPSFSPIGALDMEIEDLQLLREHKLKKMPLSSPLTGEIILALRSSLELKVRHFGFLTMMQGPGIWVREWCCLSGHVVSYWNYPQDHFDKDALGQIDLREVLSERIALADRSLCSRPRTLLLETHNARHLWHVDTKEELMQWCTKLNQVVEAIRMWNVA